MMKFEQKLVGVGDTVVINACPQLKAVYQGMGHDSQVIVSYLDTTVFPNEWHCNLFRQRDLRLEDK